MRGGRPGGAQHQAEGAEQREDEQRRGRTPLAPGRCRPDDLNGLATPFTSSTPPIP